MNYKNQIPAFVMVIVNVTPDSFRKESRGGIEHARMLINQGVDILYIGGESSRPGCDYVSAEEELSRKTCIGQITGKDVPDRLSGTLAADLISVMLGASLVRVHDVEETVDILKVLSALKLN